MLAHLTVRDFVLIDELDLAFSDGFNVLTGETGAGKSLIATAVDLLLGKRASGELVRTGAKEAAIEGLFDISDEPEVQDRLCEAGLPADDNLLVRRVIPSNGRHRCYVNGHLASLSLLSKMSDGLAKLMSQHEQLTLLNPAAQLDMIDGFGQLESQTNKMAKFHSQVVEAQGELETLQNRERDREVRLDYLSFQLDEIEQLAPREGELDQLDQDVEKMRHGRRLTEIVTTAANNLYESDGSVFELIGRHSGELEEAARYDETLKTAWEQLEEAGALVEEVSRTLQTYGGEIHTDPSQLSELEERREEIRHLLRKHGTDLDGIITLRDDLKREINTLSRYEEARNKAEEILEERRRIARVQAEKLTKARKRVATKLAVAVMKQLDDLHFGKTSFEARLQKSTEIGPLGSDRVEFLIALNQGEGAHPLRMVASGGELSRLMLAIKRALAGVGPVGTYVFDEVDSGIGGAVAASVGRKLQEVAKHHQVICITHLPQIAGMADEHLFVSKKEIGGRTATHIVKLEKQERVEELARMISGEKVSPKTMAAARELITGHISVKRK
jgi:DNA repair protein RecN (Recombination protein N)